MPHKNKDALLQKDGDKTLKMVRPVSGEPALFLDDPVNEIRSLIVADLHLGYEASLGAYGVVMPSQHEAILNHLKTLVLRTNSSSVYIVGDLKHSTPEISSGEWYQVPTLLEALNELVDIHLVKGNHDGDIEALCPPQVILHPAEGVTIRTSAGTFLLLHGHAWPKIDVSEVISIITAHIHPVIEFRESIKKKPTRLPVWVRGSIDSLALSQASRATSKTPRDPNASLKNFSSLQSDSDERTDLTPTLKTQLVFLPAFNKLLSGHPINTSPTPFQGIWNNPDLRLEEQLEVSLLDGTYIGNLSAIRTLGTQ